MLLLSTCTLWRVYVPVEHCSFGICGPFYDTRDLVSLGLRTSGVDAFPPRHYLGFKGFEDADLSSEVGWLANLIYLKVPKVGQIKWVEGISLANAVRNLSPLLWKWLFRKHDGLDWYLISSSPCALTKSQCFNSLFRIWLWAWHEYPEIKEGRVAKNYKRNLLRTIHKVFYKIA